ncbi:class I SAM-dependent methyltransferase [Endozoicomonas atrinae]|uniref:class I SAM-dependent methyltransferase n=1 Tax=Endozoicomonas atrinae TaxID=1333660 RepID=UPI00082691D2|nr:methyltransferase domain-containing protein [Endozoicomonas atrinae]
MSGLAQSFSGAVPENYDRYIFATFLRPFAEEMAARLRNTASKNILETAAGTGSGSLILQKSLESGTFYTVSDISSDMLTMAKEKLGNTAGVYFDLADACDLPYDSNHFDSVVSMFGLMYYDDKPTALREAHRVLKPRGKLLFCVWDRLDKNILSYHFYHKAARYFDGELPQFHKLPHNCASLDFLKTELESAGFENINITVVKKPTEECSPQKAAISFITGTPLFYELQERGIDHDQVISEMAAELTDIFGENLKGIPRQALFVEASKG